MSNRASYKGMLIALGTALVGGAAWADGNTVAASAKSQTLASAGIQTLVSGLDGEDVCATIINRSAKPGLIELTLTDDGAGITTSQIAKAKSSALCGIDTESVAVQCLGPNKCAYTWSVDKF